MTVGSLIVSLGLDRKPFESGLQSAAAKLAGLGSKIGGMLGPVAGLGGALAGLAGVGAFGAMTGSAMKTIDAIGNLASGLRMSTEALGGLHFAADQSGASAGVMDSALGKMVKNLGAARLGGGAAAGMLDKLGLSADALAGMSPDQAFLKLTDSIAGLPNAADQANAAVALFGKSGQQLVPMLAGGSEAIRGLMGEAGNLGMLFNDVDAGKVMAANDAIDKLRSAVMGTFQQVAIAAAPALQFLADGIASLVPTVTGFVREVGSVLMDTFAIAQYGWRNFSDIATWASMSAALAFVRFGADVSHFFTGTLPGLFTWFGQNWGNIWRTAVDFALTSFINLGDNIRSLFAEVWAFVSSGGTAGFNFDPKPLTEGFANSISKLPAIAAREIGPLEAAMAIGVNRLGASLGDGLSDALGKSWDAQKTLGSKSGPQLALDMGIGADLEPPSFNEKKSDGGSGGGPAAFRVGTAAALTGIVKAGTAQQEAREQLSHAKRQTKLAEQQLVELKNISANMGATEEVDF